jgi:hypothetical protein
MPKDLSWRDINIRRKTNQTTTVIHYVVATSMYMLVVFSAVLLFGMAVAAFIPDGW